MNNFRRALALLKRREANELANERPHPRHVSNGDEQKFRHNEATGAIHNSGPNGVDTYKQPSYLANYTKGLPHDPQTGLVRDPEHYQYFVRAIDSGDVRDFRDTPLGKADNMGNATSAEFTAADWVSLKGKKGKLDADLSDVDNPVRVRAWESQGAGATFDLQGPDAQAVTMPPAPDVGSAELTAEMGEVYEQALLRDIPFTAFSAGLGDATTWTDLKIEGTEIAQIDASSDRLNQLEWFNGADLGTLSQSEESRRRGLRTPGNTFRGITAGDEIGPYISQFLLAGNRGVNGMDVIRSPKRGLITYGSTRINQKVRVATPGRDYLQVWEEWLDAQNGADFRGFETYESGPNYRFIHTPRDLATFVHYDALYQAYLNACLILLGMGAPFDPGIPFQRPDNRDHQQGFAHFGGPHILSLVTEVATRALKAVRFQKFNIHRRLRPEALAARMHKFPILKDIALELDPMFNDLFNSGTLDKINLLNAGVDPTYLLPMAFPEGSPMHPAYGAGHATVAGACVTILKAFFDHNHPLCIVPENEIPSGVGNQMRGYYGYVSTNDGKKLEVVPVYNESGEQVRLTVGGELNKLASNISIGRDWAGVHYFTDYYESILMGEEIAIGILEEQKLTYGENFSMTLTKFGGDTIRI